MEQKLLGLEHPETAVSFRNLGNILREQGKLQEAETVCEPRSQRKESCSVITVRKWPLPLRVYHWFWRSRAGLRMPNNSKRSRRLFARIRLSRMLPVCGLDRAKAGHQRRADSCRTRRNCYPGPRQTPRGPRNRRLHLQRPREGMQRLGRPTGNGMGRGLEPSGEGA